MLSGRVCSNPLVAQLETVEINQLVIASARYRTAIEARQRQQADTQASKAGGEATPLTLVPL